MNCFDVVHYPSMAMEAAIDLWEQGLRAGDSTVIQLCYGYTEEETICICNQLKFLEKRAAARMKDYNPEIGF